MEKVDYKHGNFVILTNEVDYDDYPYDQYVQECEDWDNKPGAEGSQEYYDWVDRNVQDNWESDLDNIKECDEYNIPVVITGKLGLWWGSPEIEPVREESVYDALQKCMRDANSVTAEWNDGEIQVSAGHHDGCNCFTIKALSKKGIAKQYSEYKEHDFKRLPYLYAI